MHVESNVRHDMYDAPLKLHQLLTFIIFTQTVVAAGNFIQRISNFMASFDFSEQLNAEVIFKQRNSKIVFANVVVTSSQIRTDCTNGVIV